MSRYTHALLIQDKAFGCGIYRGTKKNRNRRRRFTPHQQIAKIDIKQATLEDIRKRGVWQAQHRHKIKVIIDSIAQVNASLNISREYIEQVASFKCYLKNIEFESFELTPTRNSFSKTM